MTPRELVTKWRTEAETLERYEARYAVVARQHADDLEAALRAETDDVLDLKAAAKASGYSPDRLRHMVAEGRLPNVGKKGAPRVRRGDLPKKRPHDRNGFDASALATRILAGGQ